MATDDLPQRPVDQAGSSGLDSVPALSTADVEIIVAESLAGKSSASGESVIVADKSTASETRRRRHGQRVRVIREEIENLLAANRHDGASVYAGFRFVRLAKPVSSSEEPYLDAFLPLSVACRYPALLHVQTIDFDDVFSNDKLPAGTRVVVRPGVFKTLKREYSGHRLNSPHRRRIAFLATALVALGAGIAVAAMVLGRH